MRIIKNLIDIDLKNDNNDHLIVNGNNGLIDLIHESEYIILMKWKQFGISCVSPKDKLFLEKLKLRELAVSDNFDEVEYRKNLYEKIKIANKQKTLKYNRVHFVLTYECNFACPYCYEKKDNKTKVMSKKQIDKIFDLHNNNINDIGLFGGEPLLLDNRKIIEYIISKAPNARYSIITNGYTLENYIDLLKQINIVYIQITLDGDEEAHNKTRKLLNGNGTYDKIINNIEVALQNNLPTTIRMNIHNNNIDSCMKIKKIIEDHHRGNNNLFFDIQPIFQCEEDDRNLLFNKLLEEDVNSTKKNYILKNLPPISNFLYNGTKLIPRIKGCYADNYYRFYDPYGDIYTCIASVGNPAKSVGKYWPDYNLFKNSFLERDIFSVPQCKECCYAFVCGGGCANALPDNCCYSTTPNCVTMINEINNTIPYIYKLISKKN